MNGSSSRRIRQKIFISVVLGCLALAVGYTAWVILRAGPIAQAQAKGAPLPTASPNDLETLRLDPISSS
jgi:hypothetical protein